MFDKAKKSKQSKAAYSSKPTFGHVGNFSRVWQYLNRTLETKKLSLAYIKLGSLSHS
jgi:hypothetical protein